MKLKRLINAVIAVAMVGINIFGGIIPVLAAEGDDSTVRNPKPYHVKDGDDDPTNDLVLYKTASSVSGYANKWDITLRIEAPKITVTSDTVIVIDNSLSMQGQPLSGAKTAASSLASILLEDSEANRVAVIAFDGNTHNISGFSNDEDTVVDAIDGITIGGIGTFTQKGLHEAATLLESSDATYKNVVLLSDGAPNYVCDMTNPDNYLETVEGQTGRVVRVLDPAEGDTYVFNCNTRQGDGNNNNVLLYRYGGGYGSSARYYHYGNGAVSEANFFKNTGGVLHTIAFNAGESGSEILSDMASTGKYHPVSTNEELQRIFEDIAGEISDLVSAASVHDVMGEGVIVEDTEHSTEVDWENIEFTYDSDLGKYVATYTYEVEAGEHILDAESTDGFHPLNEDATLTYTDANGQTHREHFPVPYVKPFFINVTKEIEGQTCAADECIFNFKIEHPAGEKTTNYTVEAGKTHSIVESFPIGNYTLTETGTNSGNPVKFENYLVSYTGNTFAINEQHADHIDVTIKNKYETTSVSASKVWDDGGDQDGLRENYDDFWVVVKDSEGNYAAMQELTGADKDYSFTDLPKNYNGSEIAYKVVEASGCEEDDDGVITCEKEFNGNNGEVSIDSDYTTEVGEGNVITNKHTPITVKITVNKDWNDENNRDGLRTENKQVEFCVTGTIDGEVVYQKTCKQASSLLDEIEVVFTGLPKNKDGVEIEYMVEESEFLGYNVTGLPEEAFTVEDEENLNATNTHKPEKISILIEKIWDDEENKDNLRPDEIYVTLSSSEGDVNITFGEDSSVEGKCEAWCVEVTDLYKYANGSEIEYSVTEEEVDGYTTEVSGDAESGFTITNTHESEPEPEPDPCDDGEGCGGEDTPIVPPITPETGVFTGSKGEVVASSATNWIGGTMVAMLAGVSVVMLGVGKLVNRVKIDKKA